MVRPSQSPVVPVVPVVRVAGPGLRERKKQKTRWAIQQHAVRLFTQHGYEATTVDQIAEAAEISPSTFFRYFPTKEDVILGNAHYPALVEAIALSPLGLTPAQMLLSGLRAVVEQIGPGEMDQNLDRFRLVLETPGIRARAFDGLYSASHLITEAVAQRLSRADLHFELRVFAQAATGAILAAIQEWVDTDGQPDPFQLVERALIGLDQGFSLLGVSVR